MAKKRKVTTLTFNIKGETIRRKVSYHSAADLAEKRAKIETELLAKSKVTFSKLADAWFNDHEQTIEHYTAESYKAPLKDLKSAFGEMEVCKITSLSAQAFLNRMAAQGYAQQTIKLRKIALSQILDYAVMMEYVSYNVAKVCKVPKRAAHTVRQPPSEQDVKRIKAAPDGMWKSYFLFLMYTGLRREEALAITKADLDFENCVVTVNKVVIFESNRPVLRDYAKTDAGNRLAPFPQVLHPLFSDHPDGLLFHRDGHFLNKGNFDKGIGKFKTENGIDCTSHQLRHYFASMCHGVIAAKDAQHLLGHAKVATTLDIYTNIDQTQKQAALQKLNEFIQKNA